MTLCELLMELKSEKGGTFEVAINRSWDLPTFNYDALYNTIDEWIDGFKCADVWWSNRDDDTEDGSIDERHAWEMELLFSDAELINEDGPYEEPAGQWINIDC